MAASVNPSKRQEADSRPAGIPSRPGKARTAANGSAATRQADLAWRAAGSRVAIRSPGLRGDATSALQAPFIEFLRSSAELTQLVDGCACRRERERLERFREHLVEVITRGNACGDVRTEMLAG